MLPLGVNTLVKATYPTTDNPAVLRGLYVAQFILSREDGSRERPLSPDLHELLGTVNRKAWVQSGADCRHLIVSIRNAVLAQPVERQLCAESDICKVAGHGRFSGRDRPRPDEVDGSCSTGIKRAKVQLSSTAGKGATQ